MILTNLKHFKKSNEMEVMLVTGGLAMATGDLPQGQLYAGIQSHKAHIGSRVCYVHQTEFLDLSKDCSHRLLQTENEKLQNLRNLQPKDQEEFTKLNGLTPDVNWMENLNFDRCNFFLLYFHISPSIFLIIY